MAPDPALATALLLDTLDGVAASGVMRVVAVEPPTAVAEVRAMVPADVRVITQADGDLGERMRAAMTRLFEAGAPAVAVVGSDLPDIQPALIEQAFAALDDAPRGLVLGPAHDGGYYLVAATSVPPIFDGIEWGSARVFEQTLAAARAAALEVRVLDPLGDVDNVGALLGVRARRTQQWVAAWRAAGSLRGAPG